MYICICKGITDNDIKHAVYEGASSYRKVRKQLGVGTGCGQCACDAKVIIKEASSEMAQVADSTTFYAAG